MASRRWLLQWCMVGLFALAGCVPQPPQPESTAPYALLEFPSTARLLALDGQEIDSRLLLRHIRVIPGRHTLHFAYAAVAPGGSRQHDGQLAAPFTLDTQSGYSYVLEAKT